MLAAFTALAELHAWQEDGVPLGFSHGDLCPDHVLIDGAGVTFIDLGQARYASLDTTDLGAERGTLPYVAPELARGDVAPDPTNDVYALAACFAHVLLGRDPCRHPHGAARLVEIADEGVDRAAIQAASQAPRTVIETLLAALHPERSRRLQRAADVADSLRGG